MFLLLHSTFFEAIYCCLSRLLILVLMLFGFLLLLLYRVSQEGIINSDNEGVPRVSYTMLQKKMQINLTLIFRTMRQT